jgi:hypothetical protein
MAMAIKMGIWMGHGEHMDMAHFGMAMVNAHGHRSTVKQNTESFSVFIR